MAMTTFFQEQALREQFREMAAQDRQLTRWGWFQRPEHRPRGTGWRFLLGEGLVRLGCWLQRQKVPRQARTSGEI